VIAFSFPSSSDKPNKLLYDIDLAQARGEGADRCKGKGGEGGRSEGGRVWMNNLVD